MLWQNSFLRLSRELALGATKSTPETCVDWGDIGLDFLQNTKYKIQNAKYKIQNTQKINRSHQETPGTCVEMEDIGFNTSSKIQNTQYKKVQKEYSEPLRAPRRPLWRRLVLPFLIDYKTQNTLETCEEILVSSFHQICKIQNINTKYKITKYKEPSRGPWKPGQGLLVSQSSSK